MWKIFKLASGRFEVYKEENGNTVMVFPETFGTPEEAKAKVEELSGEPKPVDSVQPPAATPAVDPEVNPVPAPVAPPVDETVTPPADDVVLPSDETVTPPVDESKSDTDAANAGSEASAE